MAQPTAWRGLSSNDGYDSLTSTQQVLYDAVVTPALRKRAEEIEGKRFGRQLFWIAVRLRSKVVPLMGIQYRLARWPYGTKGLKSLRVGTAGRGTWRTIENIYSAILARRAV